MKQVQAWLLDLGPFRIAAAYQDVLEVVSDPVSWPLPIGPRWCREVLVWRGRYIPLARLGSGNYDSLAVVIAVDSPSHDEQVEYVALRLRKPPELIHVSEQDDCELPRQLALPANHVLACFKYADEAVLIPDFSALFKISELKAA